jgi:hypothetical protein
LRVELIFENIDLTEFPISTYYEVCDSRMACSLVVGPNVTVDLVENMPASEMTFRVAQIAAQLQRMEYDSAFEKAIATMLTLRVSHQLMTQTTTYLLLLTFNCSNSTTQLFRINSNRTW